MRLISEDKKITNLPDFLIKYRINQESISFRKRLQQELFSKKIIEFYYQRKNTGKDDYDEFNPKDLEKMDGSANFERIKKEIIILSNLQTNNKKRIRKEIKEYFRKYGVNHKMMIYYLISFFPKKLIDFAKEKI